jgi:hypothetical protein
MVIALEKYNYFVNHEIWFYHCVKLGLHWNHFNQGSINVDLSHKVNKIHDIIWKVEHVTGQSSTILLQ